MPKVISKVVDQLAEESAFLWELRDAAVSSPHYLLADLARLDARVEAQLDGLITVGEPGWSIILQHLETGNPGEVFAAAMLAFQGGDTQKIQTVLEKGTATPEASRGLASALGWISYEPASPHIRALLNADGPLSRRTGIAVSALHRKSPGPALPSAYRAEDPRLRARAFRAAGELGLTAAHVALGAGLKASQPEVRFWAAWSDALLTGSKEAVACLRSMAEAGGSFAERAATLAIRQMPHGEARTWIRRLARDLRQVRIALAAAGANGDPESIPLLIEQMREPRHARAAGEAFSLITGVHLSYDILETEKPVDFESGPTEDPADANVAMDADQDLYWPDPVLVQKWWNARQGSYSRGTRYLLGKPISVDTVAEALRTGYQRQRAAAAIELALLKPGGPLFEVRAPGSRQQRLLSAQA